MNPEIGERKPGRVKQASIVNPGQAHNRIDCIAVVQNLAHFNAAPNALFHRAAGYTHDEAIEKEIEGDRHRNRDDQGRRHQ